MATETEYQMVYRMKKDASGKRVRVIAKEPKPRPLDKERAKRDLGDSFEIPPDIVSDAKKESFRVGFELSKLLDYSMNESVGRIVTETMKRMFNLGYRANYIADNGRCDSCRWWGKAGAPHCGIDGVTVLECQSPMVIQPTYGERNNRNMRPDGVYTCDEGGCTGELMTGPNFGCVHYERRK